MLNVISPCQTVEEICFIRKQTLDTRILPLDLNTLLFSIKNNFNYISPKLYSDNKLHVSVLKKTDNILCKLKVITPISIHKEYLAVCRFYLHQVFFIQVLLERILEEISDVNFLVSGWMQQENLVYSDKNYFVSNIVKNLFPDKTIFIQKNLNKHKKSII